MSTHGHPYDPDQHSPDERPTMTLAEPGAEAEPQRGKQPESSVSSATPVPGSAPVVNGDAHAESENHSGRTLFADDELTGLRARWSSVQAGFVDDPRDCVQRADGLVTDVVAQLAAGFSDARSRLEAQWGRGEEATTEDLRVALTRYRDFFERLLAV